MESKRAVFNRIYKKIQKIHSFQSLAGTPGLDMTDFACGRSVWSDSHGEQEVGREATGPQKNPREKKTGVIKMTVLNFVSKAGFCLLTNKSILNHPI